MITSKELNRLNQRKQDLIRSLDLKRNKKDLITLEEINRKIEVITREMVQKPKVLERQITINDWQIKDKVSKKRVRKCRKG